MHLSLVIPAFNEEKNIGETLLKAERYLSRQTYESEIIVIDDGSTDGTLAKVRSSFPNVETTSYSPNQGKGFAVRAGMMAAKGDYRVFYDADGSTPIEELEKLWPCFNDGADIVIGSRDLSQSEVVVHQSWLREHMGRVFNLLVKIFALGGFPDTQCGFKGFTAAACEVVFPRQTLDGFAFDVELLYLARKHGLRVDQVPVKWINEPETKVNLVTGSFSMLLELLTIRFKNRKGNYD